MKKILLNFVNDPKQFIKLKWQLYVDGLPVAYTPWLKKKGCQKYSVVSAVYNVENYLDDFFYSITNQTLVFENHIELIMVDDGSLDESAEIIKKWSKKYPNNIKYIKKENEGQATARNLGIKYVNNDWVTFIDPDDFINKKYFETVDSILSSGENIGMVSCNTIFYREANKDFSDTHPLRYRFNEKIIKRTVPDLQKHIQLSASSAFFKIDLIRLNKLSMDSRVKPTFEDAHFVCRYLLAAEDLEIVFTQLAKYFYRKRLSSNSTLDTAWNTKEQFNDKLRFGYLSLLKLCGKNIPEFIQRTILYELFWYTRLIVNNKEKLSFLTDTERKQFLTYFKDILSRIDDDIIQKFELVSCDTSYKIAWLGFNKEYTPLSYEVEITSFDETKNLLKLNYFYKGDITDDIFQINKQQIDPKYTKVREYNFLEEVFILEKILWLPVDKLAKSLTIQINQKDTIFSYAGKKHNSVVDVPELIEFFKAPKKKESDYSFGLRALRLLAKSSALLPTYQNLWVFVDRDIQADDNAEHLYRYISKNQRNFKGCFLLRKNSHDWKRLKNEGFNLVKFGSLKHMIVMFNAHHLISSHADHYILNFPPQSWFEGIMKYKYTFLQHGVTKDDLSNWLNNKDIDVFITASEREYDSIAGKINKYKFSSKEVCLTGFARHDELLIKAGKAKAGNPAKKTLLVMPTWRESLVGKTYWMSNKRKENDEFYLSEYAQHWKQFLHSKDLELLAEEFNLDIIFFPHTNMTPYINWFDVPPHISSITHRPEQSIQDLFVQASLLITDYSSVAFEVAYLDKPVIYYQFDSKEVFGGGHTTVKGYYDYEKDGFGPVCTNENQVLTTLKNSLRDNFKMEDQYKRRTQSTFKFRDGKSCQRVYKVISELDKPVANS